MEGMLVLSTLDKVNLKTKLVSNSCMTWYVKWPLGLSEPLMSIRVIVMANTSLLFSGAYSFILLGFLLLAPLSNGPSKTMGLAKF